MTKGKSRWSGNFPEIPVRPDSSYPSPSVEMIIQMVLPNASVSILLVGSHDT